MSDLHMDKGAVDKSAAAVKSVGDNVKGVDVAAGVAMIAAALPGTPCVESSNSLKSTLTHDRDAWAKQAHEHHDLTTADAAAIQAADERSKHHGRHLQASLDSTSAHTPSSAAAHQRLVDRLGSV